MKSFKSNPYYRHHKEVVENWRKLGKHIPFIKLEADWTIAVIPPYANAAVRFLIQDTSGAQVSVYLDTSQALGYSEVVYWEVYPDETGDVSRVAMEDDEELVSLIKGGMQYAREHKK